VPIEHPKAQPKASPSPKIINIETVERVPAPVISVPEPPSIVTSAVDPAAPND